MADSVFPEPEVLPTYGRRLPRKFFKRNFFRSFLRLCHCSRKPVEKGPSVLGRRLCGRAADRSRTWRCCCWAICGPRAPWRTGFSAPCCSSPGRSTCGRPCSPGGRSDPSRRSPRALDSPVRFKAGTRRAGSSPSPGAAATGPSVWGCPGTFGDSGGGGDHGRLGF